MAIPGVVSLIMTTALTSQIAGASSSTTRQHTEPKAKTPVTIRIKLDQSHVMAGAPIKGTAILTNNGSKAMLVQQCATDGWLDVGLVNKTIPYSPVFALVGCRPTVRLSPGVNRFPVTVVTTYQSCLQPGGQSLIPTQNCVPTTVSANPLPPLPAGRYATKVVTMGLPSNTAVSNSVVVTLRASTSTTRPSAAAGASPMSLPPCTANSLAVHGGRQGGGFVGDAEATIVLTNTGPSACSLSGEPLFALRSVDGSPLTVQNKAQPLHPIRPLTLQPQGSAYVIAEWSNWCGTTPGPLDLTVTLPNDTPGVTGAFDGPPNYNFVPQCTETNQPSGIQAVNAYLPNA